MNRRRWKWQCGVDVRYCYPRVRCWVEEEQEWRVRRIRVVVRRLWLKAETEVIGPGLYRVVRTERKGVVRYSVCGFEEPKKPLWPELKLRPETVKLHCVRVGSMDEQEISEWLRSYLGGDTSAVLHALAYAEPES